MARPFWTIPAAGVLLALGLPGVARADSLSPYVWFWPGIVSLGLLYAFTASLLAAFLERPFVTAAGIPRRALVLSLRANCLSAMVGILLLPIGAPALESIGPLWCVVAFVISCVVEVVYLRRFKRDLAVRWIVLGNVVSSGVLMTLPPLTFILKTTDYHVARLARFLEPHEFWLGCTTTLASLAILLASFAVPVERISSDAESAGADGPSTAD
jgi:hypothetical protein